MLTSVPDAIMRERESMLAASLALLRRDGYRVVAAREVPGLIEPEALLVHVLNIHVQPDISAQRIRDERPLHAFVEVSSALGETEVGRRWQALAAWCRDRAAEFCVFVHPEDLSRARTLAGYWHVDPNYLRAVERP